MNKPLEMTETTYIIDNYRPCYAIKNPNMECEPDENNIIAFTELGENDTAEWVRVLNAREDVKKALEKVMISFNPKYMNLDQDQKEALIKIADAYEKFTGKEKFKKW